MLVLINGTHHFLILSLCTVTIDFKEFCVFLLWFAIESCKISNTSKEFRNFDHRCHYSNYLWAELICLCEDHLSSKILNSAPADWISTLFVASFLDKVLNPRLLIFHIFLWPYKAFQLALCIWCKTFLQLVSKKVCTCVCAYELSLFLPSMFIMHNKPHGQFHDLGLTLHIILKVGIPLSTLLDPCF